MRVLLLGFDTPLGAAIVERQTTLGRHEFITMSRSACRWKSERQAKKSVVRAKSDIVVDVRIEAAGDSGTQIQQQDLKRCHWVAKACQRSGTAYVVMAFSFAQGSGGDRYPVPCLGKCYCRLCADTATGTGNKSHFVTHRFFLLPAVVY